MRPAPPRTLPVTWLSVAHGRGHLREIYRELVGAIRYDALAGSQLTQRDIGCQHGRPVGTCGQALEAIVTGGHRRLSLAYRS